MPLTELHMVSKVKVVFCFAGVSCWCESCRSSRQSLQNRGRGKVLNPLYAAAKLYNTELSVYEQLQQNVGAYIRSSYKYDVRVTIKMWLLLLMLTINCILITTVKLRSWLPSFVINYSHATFRPPMSTAIFTLHNYKPTYLLLNLSSFHCKVIWELKFFSFIGRMIFSFSRNLPVFAYSCSFHSIPLISADVVSSSIQTPLDTHIILQRLSLLYRFFYRYNN